jgi:hypothetical protein
LSSADDNDVVIDVSPIRHPVLRIGSDQAERLSGDNVGISLRHDDRPHLWSTNRRSERRAVNEMKSALFARTDNDCVVVYAGTEIFAAIVASRVTMATIEPSI